MEPPEVQNVEGAGQNQNIDPEPAIPEAPEVIPNPVHRSAFDAIFRSVWNIDVFREELARSRQRPTRDELEAQLRGSLVNKLTDPAPMATFGDIFLYRDIVQHLPGSTLFVQSVMTTNICRKCKWRKVDQDGLYDHTISAVSLRLLKSAIKELTFESILKANYINILLPCENGKCERLNYVERVIRELPSVFAFGLFWELDETGTEIRDTVSALKTEIDVSAIFKWEGDGQLFNYRLISMVCMRGNQYICVAYKLGKWVRHVGSEEQDIGDDWMSVMGTFTQEHIRPVILFFQQDMGSGALKISGPNRSKPTRTSTIKGPKLKGIAGLGSTSSAD